MRTFLLEGNTQREDLSCSVLAIPAEAIPGQTQPTTPRRVGKYSQNLRNHPANLQIECISFGYTSFRWLVTNTIAYKISYYTQSHSTVINSLEHKLHERTFFSVLLIDVSKVPRTVPDTL